MNIFKRKFAVLFFALLMVSAFTITAHAKSIHNNKPKSTGWINAGVVMDVYTEDDIPPTPSLYGGSPMIAILPYYGTINVTITDLTSGGSNTYTIPPHGNPCVFTLNREHRYQIKCNGKWKVTTTDRVSILSW